MLSIVFSTKKEKSEIDSFKNHLINSIGLKEFEILCYTNKNEYSLTEIYNKGLKESKYELVVFCHDDIFLEKNWGNKLLKDFEKNPNFGIIGKAGSCEISNSGIFWENINKSMVGHVFHRQKDNTKILNKYSIKSDNLIEVVVLDGFFISVNKKIIKKEFDESIKGFHFYDHSFCIQNYLNGVKIGVTFSFEITHDSIGNVDESFMLAKENFLEKYGEKLPIILNPKEILYGKIKKQKFKNFGKVAVIIPNKSNNQILFNCVNSFLEHCDNSFFELFIADTGSKEDELIEIEGFIKNFNNVKLLKFNYYNFAKINNQVVKNSIGDDFEFILFCNNDIEILNDVVTSMLNVFKKNTKCGSVGARLHYPNNTVQHNGVIIYSNMVINANKSEDIFPNIILSHDNLNCFYKFDNYVKEVFCNTAALLMIRKKLFLELGGFNEIYKTCFEDVDLGIKILLKNLINYNDGLSVAYHKESYTRGKDKEEIKKVELDYKERLLPFIHSNINKIEKYFRIKNKFIYKDEKYIKL